MTMGKIKPGDLVTINMTYSNTDVYYFWPYPYDHCVPEFHPKIYYYKIGDPPMLYLGPSQKLKTNPDSSHLQPHSFLYLDKVVYTQLRETDLLEKVFQKVS